MALRLFLLQPEIVFQAQVATNPSASDYPVDQVTFDNVSTGAYTDILPGQVVYFGSSAGARDHGIQRIRKAATSDTIYIGRTSRGYGYGEITPVGDSYITVVNLRQVISKPPYIAIDESDSTAQLFKDADIAFVDQTEESPPVANTGPGTMATINGSNVIVVEFDGTSSFATADGASISSYLWDIADGSLEGGYNLTDDTIQANFPAGFRYVSLTVTDDNGKTHTAYCPVFARDPADDDAISGFTIESHRITADGQEITVAVVESIPESTYPDGTLAMLADGEPSSPGDRSHMVFIGWVQQDSNRLRAERTGFITRSTLTLVDVAGRLQRIHAFSEEVLHVPNDDHPSATPDDWGQMPGLNMDRYMHYLFYWHSTALELADWVWSGTGATLAMHARGNDAVSLWGQLAENAEYMTPDHKLTCNRLGQLQVLPDPMIVATGSRTSTIQTTIDESEWSEVRYDHEQNPRVFWVWGGAVLAGNDLNGEGLYNLIFCKAPGAAPGLGATEIRKEQGITPDTSTLLAGMGNLYARVNAPEGPLRFTLAGASDFDIEPANMTWVQATVGEDAAAAPRGLVLSAERCLPLEINKRYSFTRTGRVDTVELVLERETFGQPAVAYEPERNDRQPNTGDWWDPDDYFDDNAGMITFPITGPPPILQPGVQDVVLVERAGDIYRTFDFQSDPPTWDQFELPGGGITIHDFTVDPFSPAYLGSGTDVNGYIATSGSIRKIIDMFGTSPTVDVLHTFATNIPGNGYRAITASFGRFFSTQSDNPWIVCVSHYIDTAGHTGTWATYSVDGGQTWSSEVQITEHYTTSSEGVYEELDVWVSPRTPGYAITTAYTSTESDPGVAAYYTDDWGATWQALDPSLVLGNRLSPGIHVPWQDNADESIIYYSQNTVASPIENKLKRFTAGGSPFENETIAPEQEVSEENFRLYGIGRKWGVRSSDTDRQKMICAGRGNDNTASTAGDFFAVWYSSNGGDSWAHKTTPSASTKTPRSATFFANSEDEVIIYGRNWFIQYTDDIFTTTVDGFSDKEGNLATLAGGNRWIKGIAGGGS